MFGTAGLVCFGIYFNRQMGSEVSFFPWLWAAGGLLIYNLDRYLPEPSDQINHPDRATFRHSRLVIIILSASVLVVTPILVNRVDIYGWLAIALALSLGYSAVPPGFRRRFKDRPLLKWWLPPIVILTTLSAPTWQRFDWGSLPTWSISLAGGLFSALLINVLLSDAQDSVGDRAHGLSTIGGQIETRKTCLIVWFLIVLQCLAAGFRQAPGEWLLAGYHGLIAAAFMADPKRKISSWVLDGMLFVPIFGKWIFW